MTFGHRDIFRYPAVQYIPLRLYDEHVLPHVLSRKRSQIYLFRKDEENKLLNLLKHSQAKENYSIERNQLAIVVRNGKVDFIKYRSHQVFMIGGFLEGKLNLFKVTKNYFYKNKLIFTFYNSSDEQLLARENFVLNI